MKGIKNFMLGFMTAVILGLGIFIYNTVGVYTQTTYVYNPSGITSMFGSYSEVTK